VRASLQQLFFAPFLIVLGFSILFVFQNCSRDVSFDAQPSTVRPDQFFENDIRPDGFTVGGDADVIIRFNETPGDLIIGDDGAVIDYEVIVPDGTPNRIRCFINGVEVTCGQTGRIPVIADTAGPQDFRIEVDVFQDDPNRNDRVVVETITWTVFERIIERTKSISVNELSDDVDIIINVDNSGSMEFEQSSMASRIATFMDSFQGQNYHISVITTSPIGTDTIWKPSLTYVDGKFLELNNNDTFCVRHNQFSSQQAQDILQSNVVRGLYLLDDNGQPIVNPATGQNYPEGNGWERGIFTTYRAVERSTVAGSPESQCLRQGVAKHVVLISDERETLTDNSGTPLPDVQKSNGDGLRSLFASVFPNTIFKFHSIIVNPFSPEGEACLASHGAQPGIEYAQLSRDTGGVIGSVCASDYGAQLGQIGQSVNDSKLSYTLDCVSATGGQVPQGQVINVNTGQQVSVEYRLIGDKVEFAELLPPGEYRVIHYCYE